MSHASAVVDVPIISDVESPAPAVVGAATPQEIVANAETPRRQPADVPPPQAPAVIGAATAPGNQAGINFCDIMELLGLSPLTQAQWLVKPVGLAATALVEPVGSALLGRHVRPPSSWMFKREICVRRPVLLIVGFSQRGTV